MKQLNSRSIDFGYMDTLSGGDSLLHRLDPRAKLFTTAVFIIAVVSFGRYEVSALTPFLIYPCVLIALGGLPAGYILKKVLLVAPFALIIGAFNPVIDRQVLLQVGSVGIAAGWVSLASIVLRFLLTVSAALALVSLTGVNAVCASLLRFGVPRVFVTQLLFLYRYIFVLTDEAGRMARARALRSRSARASGMRLFIPLIGQLLLRTLDRAERVFIAMRCRGFDGRMPLLRPLHMGYREGIFMAGWIVAFAVARCINLPLALGSLVTGGMR